MTPTTQPTPMRAFVVTVRGLQYVAMARSACMAVVASVMNRTVIRSRYPACFGSQ